MIGKITTGKSFGGCVRYVVQKDKAEILYGEGLRLENTSQMTRDFNMQRLLNLELQKAVAHISLNFSDTDKGLLTNERMLEMAKEYLRKMNIKDTQMLIVRHNDAAHPHCHLIYNRIGNDGKTISDQYQYLKNVKVCKEMTVSNGLHMAQGKTLVNRQTLKGADQKKYQMHDIIRSVSLTAKNWKQFEKQLSSKGIEMQFKYAGQTKTVQGISFKMGDYLFKGSEIDRSFSFGKLDKTLEANASVEQTNQDKWTSEGQSTSFTDQLESTIGEQTNKESLLDMLLDAEISIEPDPEPFWLKKKKKGESQSPGKGLGR